MKCPYCKEVKGFAYVISECSQIGYFDNENNISNYEDTQIGLTLRIECAHCRKNITKFVKEN